ncbi:hypothetical protein [Deferribacter desulfuricans]|uniref:hypothetical protein n=1 Tax=Deferribacter desulfuricans TaxID=197162 RepID=UPI0002F4AB71|nr:hypothetical protein [Deferribacter desulfuricans]
MDKDTLKAYEKLIKKIIWDYNISPKNLLDVIFKKKISYQHFTYEKLVLRALERLSYYDLLFLFGVDGLKEILSDKYLKQLRDKELRGKYERLRKILSGEPIPFSRWNPEYIKKTQNTLLFNRWNSIK